MDYVMVVVVCYYGGVKFGIGGLVWVYGGVVVECLWMVFCLDVCLCCIL